MDSIKQKIKELSSVKEYRLAAYFIAGVLVVIVLTSV